MNRIRLKKIGIKFLLTFSTVLIAAYVINARHHFFDISENLTASRFRMMLWGTVVLLSFYLCMLTFVINVYFEHFKNGHRSKLYGIIWRLFYGVLATFPVLAVHALFLQILLDRQPAEILFSSYWTTDFLYFAPFLFGYILLIYCHPSAMMFRVWKEKVDAIETSFIELWREKRNPEFLLEHLRAVISGGYTMHPRKVRFFDILFIKVTSAGLVLYFTNGGQMPIKLTTADIEDWKLSGWFVRTSRYFFVNMLYVKYPLDSINYYKEGDCRYLTLEDETMKSAMENLSTEKTKEQLRVTRTLDKNVKDFLNNINQLGEEGWEEYIASK